MYSTVEAIAINEAIAALEMKVSRLVDAANDQEYKIDSLQRDLSSLESNHESLKHQIDFP